MLRISVICGFVLAAVLACPAPSALADELPLGPLYQEFKLTLDPGSRVEMLGPLYSWQEQESTRVWAVPPVLSYTLDEETDFAEFDFLYPAITYDRYGSAHRFQILQLFSIAGGESTLETNERRFTLFPLYFQQRSDDPARNYTALIPLYGRLQNRLFRDEVRFVLLPLYVQSRKRDIVTDNYVYPLVHIRRGQELSGWQVWPLVGYERKGVTERTNQWGEVETMGGHDKFFACWPLFFNQRGGLGTEKPERRQACLPLYSWLRSPDRDSFTAPWPLGYTRTEDRAKGFTEWGAPWPFVVFARGEGKTTSRVWPFFSRSHSQTLENNWYAWPIYKFNRIRSDPLDRQRTRVLFFLYSEVEERNTETQATLRRVDFWPLFTHRRDYEGKERLQVLSLLEPILAKNRGIERNWSPLWSLWRSEKNPAAGASSQSLLWNLYRRQTAPASKKCSLLFGLFQYESSADARRWRLFYLPFGTAKRTPVAATRD